MSHPDDWANAYARQAEADFNTWEMLHSNEAIPDCHKLMFLQMACEKLTKAHLCVQGRDPKLLQSSHACTAVHLPVILRRLVSQIKKIKNARGVNTQIKHIAQEIELLAPAIKRGGQRPDNCEYPWEDEGGRLHVPLDWEFTPSRLLTTPGGTTFLKLVREQIRQFLDSSARR